MADNYGFQQGSDATARADEIVAGILLPYVGALSAVPFISGFKKQAVTAAAALSEVPAGATHALITVDTGGGDLRYREDTTNPKTDEGLLVPAGGALEVSNLSAIRVISTAGTCNLNISYRRYDK